MAIRQCGTNYCNDFVIKPGVISDNNTMVINIGATTDKKAYLYKVEDEAVTPVSGGGGGGSAITLYYDVLVDVLKDKYTAHETISAEIIIINKGKTPDRDGRLTTYILSPDHVKYFEKSAEFELIPPTCDYGYTYDWYEDLCMGYNDNHSPKKTIITREVQFPSDCIYGEWKYYAEYETNIQPLINVSDSFELYQPMTFFDGFDGDYSYLLLVGIILFAFIIGKRRKKKVKT